MSVPESIPPPCGIPAEFWCKNSLQQYTQRASMPLPMYETFNEGAQHAPLFRSRVWVDGTCFISPNTFSNRKMAEQDVAKHALIGIREKVKNEGRSHILEDTVFCKSIINEYALKMNLKTPTYVTNVSKAMLPMFVSSLDLNGLKFTGDAGKNKKEAEQFAARSAILSILDSEFGTTMSEIVRSKFKFYDALKKAKDPSSSVQGCAVPAEVNPLEEMGAPFSFNKRKEVEVCGGSVAYPFAAIPQCSLAPCPEPLEERGAFFSFNKRKEVEVSRDSVAYPFAAIPQCSLAPCPAIQVAVSETTLVQPSNTQPTHQSLHEFKKAKLESSSEAIALPIVFVPPASEEPQVCSTSGKKRNRRNKKAKKKIQCESSLTVASMPQTLLPACSVAQ